MNSHSGRYEVIELARAVRDRIERQRAVDSAAEDLVLQQCDPKFLRTLTCAEPRAQSSGSSGSSWWVAMVAGVALSVAAVIFVS